MIWTCCVQRGCVACHLIRPNYAHISVCPVNNSQIFITFASKKKKIRYFDFCSFIWTWPDVCVFCQESRRSSPAACSCAPRSSTQRSPTQPGSDFQRAGCSESQRCASNCRIPAGSSHSSGHIRRICEYIKTLYSSQHWDHTSKYTCTCHCETTGHLVDQKKIDLQLYFIWR